MEMENNIIKAAERRLNILSYIIRHTKRNMSSSVLTKNK